MAERRVDRIERRLRALGGRARLQSLLEEIRREEKYPDLPYQSLYMAIQLENQRLEELGERTRFITSRDGEERGWVRLREASEFVRGSAASEIEADEVRMLRGVKGEEDTAIIVTTGRFSADAQNEAKPGQNQRVVYLIDGDKLVEICKRNQIGVKMVPLPGLLVLDPEVAREAPVRDDPEAAEYEAEPDDLPERDGLTIRRLGDEMLGDPEHGLSVEEVAELSGYRANTVRVYLYDAQRRKSLGDAIRGDEKARSRALAIVSSRREAEPPE